MIFALVPIWALIDVYTCHGEMCVIGWAINGLPWTLLIELLQYDPPTHSDVFNLLVIHTPLALNLLLFPLIGYGAGLGIEKLGSMLQRKKITPKAD